MLDQRNEENHESRVERRVIVTAGAWTVPVLAMAAAAPFAAASCTGGGNWVASAPAPGDTGTASATSKFTVPRGVRSIRFEVAGAAGGGSGYDRANNSGRVLKGTLAVVPGQVLDVVVGQGGIFRTTGAGVLGGKGYGNGGDVPTPSGGPSGLSSLIVTGGSGGGGSAILSSTTPLVVAGGGAGRGHYSGRVISGEPDFQARFDDESNGAQQGDTLRSIRAQHGGNATNSAAGAAGSSWTVNGNDLYASGRVTGNSGLGPALGGASGGNGVWESATRDTIDPKGYNAAASGAGGGGYRGGGSGAVARGNWNAAGTLGGAIAVVAGGGGRGGSYFGPGTSATSEATADNGTTASDFRAPGWVKISWTC